MAIDKNKLMEALSETDAETQWFADLKLQTLRKVCLRDPQTIENFKRDFAKDPQRFLKIPKRSSQERYQELQNFIGLIADKNLQKRLTEALASHAPHREFRLAMERKVKEQRQFAAYERECAQKRLANFLKLNHLEVI
ncbi:hypothetical protein IJT10_00160 [bacterium]|nr:hypothetical protein [bacterium]